MGMYTELFIATRLRGDTPEDVIAILKYMIGKADQHPALPDHPLFQSDRWGYMLRSSSYYFVPETAHVLNKDNISSDWSFINLSNFKNYGNEAKHFVDWLLQYIDGEDEMIGYTRYEEDREPTILYSNQKE